MTYYQPDHSRNAIERLLDQDRGRVLIERLLTILTMRHQQIEDALDVWRAQTSLGTATGVMLDRVGAIVGEPRLSRPDAVYRLWIKARGLANRASGTADELLTVMRLVLGEDSTITYLDIPGRDAEVVITATLVPDETQYYLPFIMRDIVGAGIRLDLIGSASPAAEIFTFDGTEPDQGFDNGKWWDYL